MQGNHSSRRRRLGHLSLVAVSLLVGSLFTSSSSALGAACGELLTAPAGDAPNSATGGNGANLDQLDVTSAGIVAEDSENFVVEIHVKELSAEIPPNGQSVNWFFKWTYGDVIYYARARMDVASQPNVAYTIGTYNAEADTHPATGTTSGTFNEGTNGFVQVKVPIEVVGGPTRGSALTNVYANTYLGQGVPGAGTFTQIDRGPKGPDAYGGDYTMGTCIGASGAVSPGPRVRFSDTSPKFGTTVRAVASLRVCGNHAGKTIQLQRKTSAGFKKVAAKRLSDTCKATFKVDAVFKKAVFRSYWPKQDADHGTASSVPVTVQTHR